MPFTRRNVLTSTGRFRCRGVPCGFGRRGAEPGGPGRRTAARRSASRSLTATPVGPKVFVKIETNHGVTGWGEIDRLEPQVAAPLAESLFELLDGENPTRIEHLWQKLYRSHRDMRGGPFMVHTIAGIDMALWDITGKLWGVPVYRLLGGPTPRQDPRLSTRQGDQDAGAGGSESLPATRPTSSACVDDDPERPRKRVGPDGTVMFDAHCAVPPPMLIQLAAAIEPYDVLFIEEPAVPGNIEVFKRLKAADPHPAGHRRARPHHLGDDPVPAGALHRHPAARLRPHRRHHADEEDRHAGRGLLRAARAALHDDRARPLGQPARRRVDPAVPDPRVLSRSHHAAGPARKNWAVDKDGYASLPQGPGLGVEIDEAKLDELAKKPHKAEWPTRGRLKDGSIADY